jgi:hypothetical protein
MSSASIQNTNQGLENLHPALWRASQLGRGASDYVDCGYPTLAQELPGGGWPLAGMTEILVPQAGCAELQLLSPALNQLAQGKIVLINTPYRPQILALAALQIDVSQVLWLPCSNPQDALWAAEQIVRNQSCSAVLLWQSSLSTWTPDQVSLLSGIIKGIRGRSLGFLYSLVEGFSSSYVANSISQQSIRRTRIFIQRHDDQTIIFIIGDWFHIGDAHAFQNIEQGVRMSDHQSIGFCRQ